MGRFRHGAALALLLGVAVAQQGPPVYSAPAAPSGTCSGPRVQVLQTNPSQTWCCIASVWTDCTPAGGGGGGAPTTAQYWTGAADATLSAEQNLGALGTGLVINTGGVPSIYGGSSCAGANLVQTTSAAGVHGCYQLKVDQLANPAGSVTWTWPSATKMLWTFTGSTDEAFTVHGDGAFIGSGDLVHINKTGTGSAAGADALHVEVTTDPNMAGIRVTMPTAGSNALMTNGVVTAPTFAGALVGNAATATTAVGLSTAGAANQFWKNGNVWGQPAFTDISGTATSAQIPTAAVTLGGVKMAAACGAGNHVSSIVAGELTCSADSGGGGAGTGLSFWTATSEATLSAETNLGALTTGLLKHTVTAGTSVPATASSRHRLRPAHIGECHGPSHLHHHDRGAHGLRWDLLHQPVPSLPERLRGRYMRESGSRRLHAQPRDSHHRPARQRGRATHLRRDRRGRPHRDGHALRDYLLSGR
jgi:hypothetical protein